MRSLIVLKLAQRKMILPGIAPLFYRASQVHRLRVTEKADRATAEQVLDPRTRLILFKLLNRGIITEIHGCISTGKEVCAFNWSDLTLLGECVSCVCWRRA